VICRKETRFLLRDFSLKSDILRNPVSQERRDRQGQRNRVLRRDFSLKSDISSNPVSENDRDRAFFTPKKPGFFKEIFASNQISPETRFLLRDFSLKPDISRNPVSDYLIN